jgi:cytochrome c-type biogenesis protein CcmF
VIPELGHYALVLALAIGIVQGCVPFYGARRNDPALMATAVPTALAQFVFVGVSFAALTMAYIGSDFSVVNVFENSHSLKPLIYKISGVWGNHEGSMLLWVLILALFGALVALFGSNLPVTLKANVLSVQSWIAVAFILFILHVQPFLRLPRPLRAATSIRSCRTWGWRSIRRCSTSAMSASRSRSRLRSQP